jgi:hypothetical protein
MRPTKEILRPLKLGELSVKVANLKLRHLLVTNAPSI